MEAGPAKSVPPKGKQVVPKQRYMINPAVACRREPDGASLFNRDTDAVVGLNTVGYQVWQVLAQPRAREEIVAHLLSTYDDAPVEQVTADVDRFLQALQPAGFIGAVGDADGRSPVPAPARQSTPAADTLCRTLTDQDTVRFYHGRSMLGTFRPGDYLTIEPVRMANVHPGDVVVYRGREEAGESEEIVHRAVAITPAGLVTRGDNNRRLDAAPVTEETLLGRVTRVERKGRMRSVWGGRRGLLWARGLRTWRRARRLGWRLLRSVGRRPYVWLRERGLLRRLWRPSIVILRVATEHGPLVKYLHRGRAVARWRPEGDAFVCHKPYDLVIPRPSTRHPRQ
jgi:hypothetical protein